MAEKLYNYVGWKYAFAIWWEQIWRVALANALLYALMHGSTFLTPVIYNAIKEMFKYQDTMSAEVLIVVEMMVLYWAGWESLVNRYSRFNLVVENKETKRSMFGTHRHLPFNLYLFVWWSQIWRILLVPGAVLGGSLAALIAQHPHAANYSHMLNPAVVELSLYAAVVLSIWATHESLSDRYRRFRIVAEPKTFYHDGSNT